MEAEMIELLKQQVALLKILISLVGGVLSGLAYLVGSKLGGD